MKQTALHVLLPRLTQYESPASQLVSSSQLRRSVSVGLRRAVQAVSSASTQNIYTCCVSRLAIGVRTPDLGSADVYTPRAQWASPVAWVGVRPQAAATKTSIRQPP